MSIRMLPLVVFFVCPILQQLKHITYKVLTSIYNISWCQISSVPSNFKLTEIQSHGSGIFGMGWATNE